MEPRAVLRVEKSLHLDGAILMEGDSAYLHFRGREFECWLLGEVTKLCPKTMEVRMTNGIHKTFFYRELLEVSDKKPAILSVHRQLTPLPAWAKDETFYDQAWRQKNDGFPWNNN